MCGMGTGWMMAGMGVFGILFFILILLSIAALAKYLFAATPPL
jgi:hypothetical protein